MKFAIAAFIASVLAFTIIIIPIARLMEYLANRRWEKIMERMREENE